MYFPAFFFNSPADLALLLLTTGRRDYVRWTKRRNEQPAVQSTAAREHTARLIDA